MGDNCSKKAGYEPTNCNAGPPDKVDSNPFNTAKPYINSDGSRNCCNITGNNVKHWKAPENTPVTFKKVGGTTTFYYSSGGDKKLKIDTFPQ